MYCREEEPMSTELIMQSTESDRRNELGLKHFLNQYNIFIDSTIIVQNLKRFGSKTHDVAVEYGPVYVKVLYSNLTNVVNFVSFPPLKEMALALENLTHSRTEQLFLIGQLLFESNFGRFLMKSLDVCTYSFERLFKRLEWLTRDTVIVFPSQRHPPLEIRNDVPNETAVASQLPNTESNEALESAPKIKHSTNLENCALQLEKAESSSQAVESAPKIEHSTNLENSALQLEKAESSLQAVESAPKIEHSTNLENSALQLEKAESSSQAIESAPKIEHSTNIENSALQLEKAENHSQAESEPEKDPFTEAMLSSNRTIIYENVTGLEKLFILLIEVFILCPVNVTIAILRFLRTILRDFEECVYASKMNVTNSGRRVKIASPLNGTILLTRLKTLYSILVQPYLEDSVIRLEYKNYRGLSGSNNVLDKQHENVNFYWEENDSDYEPMDKTSDTCTTESSESDADITCYEINPIKTEMKTEMKSEDESKPKDD